MARKISMKQALNEALDQEMARDPRVIVMGEDIVGGMGAAGEQDAWGGVQPHACAWPYYNRASHNIELFHLKKIVAVPRNLSHHSRVSIYYWSFFQKKIYLYSL